MRKIVRSLGLSLLLVPWFTKVIKPNFDFCPLHVKRRPISHSQSRDFIGCDEVAGREASPRKVFVDSYHLGAANSAFTNLRENVEK